ncbi:hypothetical protein FLONG3_390 [Fusarium longipes]|uniref:Uncharacterized protein n=1 Tax=Fusarium longipes TaxID=694270 RepID=A0A395TA25_9HYPO|nr:hypothetical protein FLONG3_390 [Fusarium longipes]
MRSSKSPSKEKVATGSTEFRSQSFADFGSSPFLNTRHASEDAYSWMTEFSDRDTPSPMGDGSSVDQTRRLSQERHMSFPIREPSLTIRDKGTGFHDDRLTKSQGNYRQPSLRRGSGMEYQTPEILSRVYNLNRRQAQRGDIQPVRHRPIAMIPKLGTVTDKPAAIKKTSSDMTEQQKSQTEKQQDQQSIPEPRDPPRLALVDFESEIWPAVQEKVLSFVEEKISQRIEAMLEERSAELESLTRPPLLRADSSPEVYLAYVRFLQNRIAATGRNSPLIRNTEAVMSLAMDLQPGLETRLRQHLAQISADENAEERCGGSVVTKKEVHEGEEDDDEEEMSTIADDDGSVYQDDPDDIDDEDIILHSIEHYTPVATSNVMDQLRRYEKRYLESVQLAAAEREAHSRALSPLNDDSNTPNGSPNEPQQIPDNLEARHEMRQLEETPTKRERPKRNLNVKKRELEKTPTPNRAVSKRLLDYIVRAPPVGRITQLELGKTFVSSNTVKSLQESAITGLQSIIQPASKQKQRTGGYTKQ